MEFKITLISFLVIFSVIIAESEAVRRRKIIIHVPVKVKKSQHTHTLLKPVHVHHKPTVIKEEKFIKQEIHHPIEEHQEIKPIEHHEYKSPIYKEEISHEHLHHHYKHNHPDLSEATDHYGDHGDHGGSYRFESSHP